MLTSRRSFLIYTLCRIKPSHGVILLWQQPAFPSLNMWRMICESCLVLWIYGFHLTFLFATTYSNVEKAIFSDNYELKIRHWQNIILLNVLDCCIKVLGENLISYSSYLLPSLYQTSSFQFHHCHWRQTAVTVTKSVVIMINLVFWNFTKCVKVWTHPAIYEAD